MGKKSKRIRSKQGQAPSGGDEGRLAPNQRVDQEEETAENLRFEDPFVDEIEEENVMEEDDEDEDVEEGSHQRQQQDGDVEIIQSWHPLMGNDAGISADEPLEMDPTAYRMYHTLTPEWPSLSFDFLRDDLGDGRKRFPHSLQAAIGTQADRPDANSLTILRLSDLSKLPQENEDEEDVLGDEYDKDDDASSSDEEDENVDLDPVLEHYHLPHYGGVNRVRAMPQQSDIVATWSDAGSVSVYDVGSIRARFRSSEGKGAALASDRSSSNAFFTHSGHSTEGFALDWSLVKQGHLATGDNDGNIHLWTPRPEGSYEVTPSYETAATGGSPVSVEDLQWSPSEATVFCAAETGGYVSIYDTRAPGRAMLRHKASPGTADVNVASWNRLVSNLLATGSDDGTLSVWDLRRFSKETAAPPLARFSCHKTPITSVEWHPTDESMLAASDTVGAYVYDLSVEEDDREAVAARSQTTLMADIPPQLLFCHSGSQEFKELHWHPQISSCIMTTAFSGFSVFIPSNL